jgi:Tol biopolymer transport system component
MKRQTLLLLSLGLLFLIQARGISWSQTTERVSVDTAGIEGDNGSNDPAISSDGRYVAFESFATNLVAGDTNDKVDIFVRDRQTGTTTRASVDSGGNQGTEASFDPSISADGSYVAFESNANDLVAGDTNPLSDIFVHDQLGGTTNLVSVDSAGAQDPVPSSSSSPSLSSNGRYVAFDSDAELVATDTNGFFDVFVHDRDADGNGTYDEPGGISTLRVSVDSAGNEATEASVDPSISANGRYVAFSSFATDLVASDNNGKFDIFVHDRDADGNGTYDEPGGISTLRVSVDSGGGDADGDSNSPSISGDGRYVAFDSDATDLVGTDNNGRFDIFVHDLQTGTTTRVSVASGGAEANGHSYSPSISVDGRYVAFYSEADNLVVSDLNGSADVFVHDRDADGNSTYDEVGGISTVRVSVASGGGEGNGDSSAPSISSDGKYVAFTSDSDNLVGGDNNGFFDIFTYERESLPPSVDSTSPAHNSNGVAVGSSIAATFSEPMNGSTIDTTTFTLDNGVTGTVTYDANSTTARFTPSSKLHYDTTYTATITTAVRDLAGNPMPADFTWTFTTKSEQKNSGGSGPCFIATSASDWADF